VSPRAGVGVIAQPSGCCPATTPSSRASKRSWRLRLAYKPAHGHRLRFYEATAADRGRHVHVAQSHFHDIVPAVELGIRSIWINRVGERAEPAPRELPSLEGLANVLDELTP